jgi:hypothetical protein
VHLGIVKEVDIVILHVVVNSSYMAGEVNDNVRLVFLKDGVYVVGGTEVAVLSIEIYVFGTLFMERMTNESSSSSYDDSHYGR